MCIFEPSDVKVRMDGNMLHVAAKQEVLDGPEYECLEYSRGCLIPDNVEADQIKCRLDEDGVLRARAPFKKVQVAKPADNRSDHDQRVVPVLWGDENDWIQSGVESPEYD